MIQVKIDINPTGSRSVFYRLVDGQGRLIETRHDLEVFACGQIIAPTLWNNPQDQQHAIEAARHAAAYTVAAFILDKISVIHEPERVLLIRPGMLIRRTPR